jgi:membrane associated rhomboid family serine protease
MLPLKDRLPTERRPVVTISLIAANAAVWLGYQVSQLDESIEEIGYQPCEVDGSCPTVGLYWLLNVFTSMFAHGSWDHIVVNMLFLWIFGNNVEDALGRARFLLFYLCSGVAATALQSFVTLDYGASGEATIPSVGASGAIAGVLGGYLMLFPRARILSWVFPAFFFNVRAWLYLGIWFVFQLVDGGWAFTHPETSGDVAYFAHIGGFAFGFLAVRPAMAGRPPKLGIEAT